MEGGNWVWQPTDIGGRLNDGGRALQNEMKSTNCYIHFMNLMCICHGFV